MMDTCSLVDLFMKFLRRWALITSTMPLSTHLFHWTPGDGGREVTLPMQIKDDKHKRALILIEFMVVKAPSARNAIIGRPSLIALKTIYLLITNASNFPLLTAGTSTERPTSSQAMLSYIHSMAQSREDSCYWIPWCSFRIPPPPRLPYWRSSSRSTWRECLKRRCKSKLS